MNCKNIKHVSERKDVVASHSWELLQYYSSGVLVSSCCQEFMKLSEETCVSQGDVDLLSKSRHVVRENTELTQSVNSHRCIDHPEGKCANEEACNPLP